jgi:hypothetical protein
MVNSSNGFPATTVSLWTPQRNTTAIYNKATQFWKESLTGPSNENFGNLFANRCPVESGYDSKALQIRSVLEYIHQFRSVDNTVLEGEVPEEAPRTVQESRDLGR